MNSTHLSQNSNAQNQVPVYLNVYNFWPCFNKIFDPLGMGLYHTGVQVLQLSILFSDDQYMFFGFDGDQTGVGYIEPFQAVYQFKEQILLGYFPMNFFDFDEKILDPLRLQFTGNFFLILSGNSYDLLAKNCNHFAKRLTKDLKVDDKFPKKIFRVTDCCNLFRCCIPQCILNGRLDWLYPPESSLDESDQGYIQLQESVNDQIDMKMLDDKQKHKTIQQKMSPYEKKDTVTTPTAELNRKLQNQKVSQENLHHEVPKHTTLALRPGATPHLQNAHERASLNELPNLSPKSLGTEKSNLQQQTALKVQQYNHQRYPKEDIKMFVPEKRKENLSES